jgi:DNA-binding CsgD family transcriptional regulator
MIMDYSNQLPWMKINDFLLCIETLSDSKEFCMQVIKKLYSLIPYDQVRVFFLDCNGKLYNTVLIGVDKRWIDSYFEYYSKVENGNYSIFGKPKNGNDSISKFKVGALDWTNYGRDEFITDYIRPQGLKYSLGFALHNMENFSYIIFTLDRTNLNKYTDADIGIISIIQPHLENLYRNLLVNESKNSYSNKNLELQIPLTKREWEIAELLCNGMTPKNISKKLFLSLSTTYKHISNIHAKLDVSSCQELILKLMKT